MLYYNSVHVDPVSREPITVTAAFPHWPRTDQYFKRPLELLKIHFTLVYLYRGHRGQTVFDGLGEKKVQTRTIYSGCF